jgi:hypothetical protein
VYAPFLAGPVRKLTWYQGKITEIVTKTIVEILFSDREWVLIHRTELSSQVPTGSFYFFGTGNVTKYNGSDSLEDLVGDKYMKIANSKNKKAKKEYQREEEELEGNQQRDKKEPKLKRRKSESINNSEDDQTVKKKQKKDSNSEIEIESDNDEKEERKKKKKKKKEIEKKYKKEERVDNEMILPERKPVSLLFDTSTLMERV